MLAWLVGGAGAVILFLALGLFRRAETTVDPRYPSRSDTIVTGGIYRVTRNPMYVGMALVLLAIAIATGDVLNLLVLAFFLWFITRFQIRPEEEALRAKFGEAYDSYTRRVRRWL